MNYSSMKIYNYIVKLKGGASFEIPATSVQDNRGKDDSGDSAGSVSFKLRAPNGKLVKQCTYGVEVIESYSQIPEAAAV
jgi:hypothetical protein